MQRLLPRLLAALGLLLATAGAALAQTNNALAFDGVDDYVSVPNNAAYTITAAITLEAWIRTSVTGEKYITTKGDDSWYLAMNGGGGPAGVASFYLNGPSASSGGWLYGTTNLADGKWHHVAGTYDGATLRLYVDGLQENSRAATGFIPTGTSPVSLGARNGTMYWNGSLDEFRLYNTALTAAQVQADRFSASGTAAVPGSQKYYANFDQGTAGGNNAGLTSLPDQSGTGNTGTLTNFALTGTTSNWVRSFPTITGISPTSGTVGSSVSLTGTNLQDVTSFAFNGTAVSPFTTPANDLTATVTVPGGATTGPVSLASATLTKYAGPTFTLTAAPDLVINTPGQTIAGGTYNSITVNNLGSGTLADDVVVNGPIVVNSGGVLADGCHLFTGSGTFTLNAGGTFDICRPRGILSGPGTPLGNLGAVRVLGARSYSNDASYSYSGGNSQDTGDGLPAQVRSFTVGTSTDISLTNPLAVAQALTLGGAGNLVTGGKTLTLLSSASGTALVVNTGNGVVNGAATVQRYIDGSLNGGAGYRHYAAPVTNTTVADLATGGFTPVLTASYNTSATPGSTTPFPTVFGYDQSRLATATNNLSAFDKGFFVPAASSSALTSGQGYVVNIGAGQLVDFVGTLGNGTVPLSLARNSGGTAADAGWQLVGNPYPAPLDWSQVAPADRQNLDGAMYVVQSTGQYAGGYRTYVNGQSTSATNNPLIASSQGFWVRVSAGQTSGTLTFRNAQRVTSYASQVTFQRTATDPRPALRLELTGAGLADAWVTYAEAGATAAFDSQYDAGKLANSTGLNLSSVAGTDNLAIDGQAAFTAATVLPLAVGVPAAGTYTLTATALDNLPAGLAAWLRDAQTGQMVRLAVGQGYSFPVTAAQAQTLLTGRFTVQFGTSAPLATAGSALAAGLGVYPNPAHGRFAVAVPGVAGAGTVQADLLNALGQVVRRQSAALPATGASLTVATDGLSAGVYVLRLTAGDATATRRVVLD